MLKFKENCEINDVVLIKEGKDGKLIAYTDYGKVIIPINKVKCGYAKVIEIVKISEKYILVKMENIIKDYYDDISYEEFKEVLKINGYKIGFDRPFESKHEYGTEHQILAYNLSNGIVIVAETFYGSKTFNTIKAYCPNVKVSAFLRHRLMSQGNESMTVFDLCYGRNFETPLTHINSLVENKFWSSNEDINLWTYADSDNDDMHKENNKLQGYSLWSNTIDRLLLADEKIEQILGRSERLMPVFKMRNE